MLYQRGKAYSQDLRERVFAASDDGERIGEIAELLRVSVSYVSKALTRRRTTGETTARQQHSHQMPKLAPFYVAIGAYIAERGDDDDRGTAGVAVGDASGGSERRA